MDISSSKVFDYFDLDVVNGFLFNEWENFLGANFYLWFFVQNITEQIDVVFQIFLFHWKHC